MNRIINKIVCKIIGHKETYVTFKGWIGKKSDCARCGKDLVEVVKTQKMKKLTKKQLKYYRDIWDSLGGVEGLRRLYNNEQVK